MTDEDDDAREPGAREPGYVLPSAVRCAHVAARRPPAAHWFIAACGMAGAIVACLATIALTSGVCFGDESHCGPLGQATVLFSIFTVPLGVATGITVAGRQVDKATTAYRPKM